MQASSYAYFILLLAIFYLYLPKKRRRKYKAGNIVKHKLRNQEGNRKIMKELVQRFMDKDVYINLLDGKADGVVKEVTDSGIVLENKEGIQIINLDYIIKIREYPHKKGKRATIWSD